MLNTKIEIVQGSKECNFISNVINLIVTHIVWTDHILINNGTKRNEGSSFKSATFSSKISILVKETKATENPKNS